MRIKQRVFQSSPLKMRHFFIKQGEAQKKDSRITGKDARHIIHVLRLKKGDRIGLFDGRGMNYEAEIKDLSQNQVGLSIIRASKSLAESNAEIILAQAILKDKKMDHLIRQVTELGVRKWIPFKAERSIPKPDPKRMENRVQRWRRITRESLKQCGRGYTVDIAPVAPFEDILDLAASYDRSFVFWEGASSGIDRPGPDAGNIKILVLLGPEGGFTENEIKSAVAKGIECVTLGPRILKSDTATVAGVTLIQYLFGDMD